MTIAGSAIPAAFMASLAIAQAALEVVTSARHLADATLEEPQTITKIALIVSVVSTLTITYVPGLSWSERYVKAYRRDSLVLSFFIWRRERKLSDFDSWGIGYYAYVFAASAAPSAILSVSNSSDFLLVTPANVWMCSGD